MINRCVGCCKKPEEIGEYVDCAEENDMTALDYVIQEEGTYNPRNGAFLCTECYIKQGMPDGVAAKNYSERELAAKWALYHENLNSQDVDE